MRNIPKAFCMKKSVYAFLCLLLALILFSRLPANAQPKASWGKEFEMRRSTSDLSVVHVDTSGVYLEEADASSTGEMSIPGKGTSSMLMKMSSSFSEIYRENYDKELKGKSMTRLLFVQERLYLFASAFDKKEKNAYLYAAEIDKGTGNLKTGWQEVYKWNALDKSSDVIFRVSANSDLSKILITSTFTFAGQTQGTYEVKVMDASLGTVDSSFTINNGFDPKVYQLEDLIYTNSDRFIMVARIYDYEEGKKKKAKNLYFKNYNIRFYDHNGKMQKEIQTDIDGDYWVSGKLALSKDKILLAAFYSNDKAKSVINGMLLQQIDANTGDIISTHKKELNSALISDVESDETSAKAAIDTSAPGPEGLASNLVFRDFFSTPDGGMIILAEQYTKTYESEGAGTVEREYTVITCGNLYMSKISAEGDIQWLDVLPKVQEEDVPMKNRYGFFESLGLAIGFGVTVWWEGPSARPYYSSFGWLTENGKIDLFFNDHEKNAAILQEGTKIKKVNNRFRNTDCFLLTLDINTGKLTRSIFFHNKGIPIPMLRLGAVLNGTMYLVGRTEDTFSAPSTVKVGKIATGM